MPRRKPNAELRTREYLTDAEVERLTKAAKGNRYGHRDATMILVAYRHGLRSNELVDLRWDQSTSTGPPWPSAGSSRAAQHPSHPGRRTAGAAPASAGAGAQVAVRVHVRARLAVHHGRLCPHGGARWRRGQARLQGSPAHAAARLRLRAGQQGPRYAGTAGLLATAISSTRCATRSCRLIGSRTSGLIAISRLKKCGNACNTKD